MCQKNVRSVFQPCSRTPANACGNSEQCLPLASEKVRSISSAAWFEVRQSLVAFSLIYDRLLAWRSTRDSQQQWPLHHVSALATSEFEVSLPTKLHACYVTMLA